MRLKRRIRESIGESNFTMEAHIGILERLWWRVVARGRHDFKSCRVEIVINDDGLRITGIWKQRDEWLSMKWIDVLNPVFGVEVDGWERHLKQKITDAVEFDHNYWASSLEFVGNRPTEEQVRMLRKQMIAEAL